jgi:hypothetical protein
LCRSMDWRCWRDELTATIRSREDAILHWCMTNQIKARALDLVGYEDEDE